jgi:pimeloyl-ACP methyl ester carboxylesterase
MAVPLTWFAGIGEMHMEVARLSRKDGVTLAYELLPGNAPVVVFLPGFASDMAGTKALFLREACAARGQAMLRLDYSGHGASGGRFEDGTIGEWTADAAAVIAHAAPDAPLLLVGSSMGGWISLLLARDLGPRVAAMLLIAPAPDFTQALIEASLTAEQRAALDRDGFLTPPSDYGPPLPITKKLIEEGRNHLLLGGWIPINCPVRILHGMRDEDVPWRHSVELANSLASEDVRVTFIKNGGHRLSSESELLLLRQTLFTLLGEDGA